MCPWYSFVLLAACVFSGSVSEAFEAEEIVPVRLTGRTGRRLARRSEDHPTFILTAFGRNFTLNLHPDTSFISPSMKVYHIRAKDLSAAEPRTGAERQVSVSDLTDVNMSNTATAGSDLQGCFFTGTVDFNDDSVVSVSLCHGIVGTFIAHGDEYQIKPKRFGTGANASATDQPHVITRQQLTKTLRDASHSLAQSDGERSPLSRKHSRLSSGSSRRRRFVSVPRFIETLVVADASVSSFYREDTKHYVLTLVSVAAQIYKHPSIKNSLNMVVVKLLIVEDKEVGPSVSSNGGLALRNFCSWQQQFNPSSQRHPEHYDTALLFTREDICGHQSCDTLGIADVGTMCDPKRSCSVIEDNGLQAAFTIAHELGHVMSMPHDDSKNCERYFGNLPKHHVMAPVYTSFKKTSPWSPCSAFYITEFFDNGHGDCLLDAPEKILPLPTELPGVIYSLDHQCQQIFGENFSHCQNSSAGEVCSQLWCQEEGQPVCTTTNGSLPWADGTDCASYRKCLDGVCTASEEEVVDGGWGEWGAWKPCSRSCGGGVMFSYRECDQPAPQNRGKYCEGQRVQYSSCNTQACETTHGKSFREEQCEKYNNPNHFDIRGNVKQWIPKYAGVSPRDRCKLFCRARGSSEFRVFEAKVIDGTACSPDSTSICVQGQCIKAGCDLQIGSNKKLDKCGVCGGNGLSCRKISGSYNKVHQGYGDIVTIPIGATNIDIKQRSLKGKKHDGNYLAIKRENGEYILNGNFSVSTVEQDIPANGAVLKYSGSATILERIQSFRQLKEAITIQLLSTTGETTPAKIKYTFFIPKGISFSKPKEGKTSVHPFGVPQWVVGEWSECSKSCGSGWSRRTVECKDNAGIYSNHCDKDLRPADIRPCADLPCPMWQIGPWSLCSRTCGHGERHRSVDCIDFTGKVVDKEKCDSSKQPKPVFGECMYQEC
ncbi:A disintegrin and metalloproteinase with thrombospondin motifs 8 isoform X2 [Pangasianodon hypophthalmus]|uniref:A disintegrin and metalloproteinase with thrombospondin motifs 8 isoform X2 n=1 Tax=Pangasianodon hypophthalmus TaxID=310915 RepID=UPI002307E13C|nr:A disintegrin and metalloproteinase with thrombospondin motifs 8 isoform X2 [Pangasianodon hypophthalmus]